MNGQRQQEKVNEQVERERERGKRKWKEEGKKKIILLRKGRERGRERGTKLLRLGDVLRSKKKNK